MSASVAVPSGRILIVHPLRRTVVHHRRLGARSVGTEIVPSGEISLDPPGLTVAIAEFFEDLPPVSES